MKQASQARSKDRGVAVAGAVVEAVVVVGALGAAGLYVVWDDLGLWWCGVRRGRRGDHTNIHKHQHVDVLT